jgi:transcriptional regulator with GAF, ATPase, and Fis domain/Tfp pilus assembly protein PilF
MWPGAKPWIDELARGLRDGGLHIVVGDTSAGADELVAAATLTWQLNRAELGEVSIPVVSGTPEAVARQLAAMDMIPRGDEPLTHWAGRIAGVIRASSALVVLQLEHDSRRNEVVAALARAELLYPAITIVDAGVDMYPGVVTHTVPLLDVRGVSALAAVVLGKEPPLAWAAALHAASGGRAGTAIELLRSISAEAEPFSIAWEAQSTTKLIELRRGQLRGISRSARRLAVAAAVWGGRVRIDQALATVRAVSETVRDNLPQPDSKHAPGLAEVIELERAGLARRCGGDLVLDSATVAASAHEEAERAAYARAALRQILDITAHPSPGTCDPCDPCDPWKSPTGGAAGIGDLSTLAAVFLHVPLDSALAETACDVADALLALGRGDRARALAEHAISRLPKRAGLIAAGAAALSGSYRDAVEFATAAAQAGADPVQAHLLIARTTQRAGELDAAEAKLAALYAEQPSHPDVAGAYARLLVTRSQYALAQQVARSIGPPTGLRAEAAGLAAFYLGDLEQADQLFSSIESSAASTRDSAALGRALLLRGMVAQQRGQLALASDRYREAAKQLHAVGEIHAAAVADLNLGTVLSERGRPGEALPRLVEAWHVFGELGATTEQVAANVNRSNALLALGQIHDARATAESALRAAAGAPHLRAFALLVLGDTKRRLGEKSGAKTAYEEALQIATDRGDAQAQLSAHIALAELGHPSNSNATPLCASDDDRDRWTLACGRLALLRAGTDRNPNRFPFEMNPPDTGNRPTTLHDQLQSAEAITDEIDWHALALACQEVAQRATSADRMERAFRAHAVASRLALCGGDAATSLRQASLARATHEAIAATAAPAFRTALEQDPDLLDLPPQPVPIAEPRLDRSIVHLRRLLTLSRRLNSESEVHRILDEVIDTAIELASAERGFLLLRRDDGVLTPVVSRNFAMTALEASDRSLSRSIAERAAQTGEPVITVDAGVDERFAAATSVAALQLRSVMAVPLRQRAAIIGCIYVDHRLRSGAFDDVAAALLGELADIAAIAIENARLTDALRRTTASVEELNQRLAADLAERDAELVRVRADLPDRDRLRHRYDHIVGRSAAIMRMLDTIDRAATTALPVVVVGESGTGKELVARALHDASPRHRGPFVAINCGAVADTLLESELFGHVRGAFTGADRDRKGLLEVAHNGTLFLDEVAETSATMQAKLLRVLQDGVIRRVGDVGTRKVDVRIIAATQRPLSDLVGLGQFREDLRFRIEVIAIAVPALRDREGDIPLLTTALLERFASGARPRLTRAALRALSHYSWPGNVRELENVLARGVALGGDVLDISDLPEHLVAAAATPQPATPNPDDELELRPALLATERAYIAAAMARANDNQTTAARLLGLSRFGLQKKLRRLADE